MAFSYRARTAVVSFAFTGLVAAGFLWQPSHRVHAAVDPEPSTVEFYTQKVQPILQTNCYRCHGGMNRRGGLKLDTPEGLMKGGKEGPVLAPGHPEESLLIKLIRHEGPANDPMPMPPKSKLSDADIATITEWVKAGAPMPKNQ